MARTARDKEAFGTYYVTQISSGCRPLFMDDHDRRYFIDILQDTVNKFNCKIIDYCAQSDNIYHLVIDVNGGDLSKIMKSINIPYAMHAACEGKLFKDRYKSRPIIDESDLEMIRETIQSETCQDAGYSSFCISELVPCQDAADTDCVECISSINDAYVHLNQVAAERHMTVTEILKDKDTRNKMIKDIRRSSTLSLKSIGEVFGGLSESSVSKIIKS